MLASPIKLARLSIICLGTLNSAYHFCSSLNNTFLNYNCSFTVLGGYHIDSYPISYSNNPLAQTKQIKKNCLELVGLGSVFGKKSLRKEHFVSFYNCSSVIPKSLRVFLRKTKLFELAFGYQLGKCKLLALLLSRNEVFGFFMKIFKLL